MWFCTKFHNQYNLQMKYDIVMITDYLEELSAALQYNYPALFHFHYQSHSISNVKKSHDFEK